MPHSGSIVAAVVALAGCSSGEEPRDSNVPDGSWFPFLAARPDAIDFGTVAVGTLADAKLVLANVGPAELEIEDIALAEPDASFTTGWSGHTVVASGASIEVIASWSPGSVQTLDNALRIVSNDPVAPQLDLGLSGSTTFPDVEVTPTAWDFGAVDVGATSVMGVSIANVGEEPLTVTSLDYAASDGDLTIEDATLPFVVAPNESVDLRVSYRPTGDGMDAGTLTIGTDDPDEPVVAAEQSGAGVKGFVLLTSQSDAPGGVLQFRLSRSGAPLEPLPGIDGADLHYPWGLAWHGASNELFIGNRAAADGFAGSIQRFVYDPDARTFTPNGTITGNGLDGVHQVNFDPVTDELLAANYGGVGGISRFVFDGSWVANGTIAVDRGDMRGVIVSPSGATVWGTTADRTVRVIDSSTGEQRTPVATGPNAELHNLTVHDGQLYVAGWASHAIYRFDVGADDELWLAGTIDATGPVSVAFSPDGLEMYSSSHMYGLIERFAYDEIEDTWTLVDSYDTGMSIGPLLVVE